MFTGEFKRLAVKLVTQSGTMFTSIAWDLDIEQNVLQR